MGKNKLAKFAEMKTFDHVVQVPFGQLTENCFELKGKWGELFFGNANPIVLELGCGKGEYTVGLAKRFPDKNFIGIDIKGARIWSGAKEANQLGLQNAAFLRTNIELLSSFFDEGEVSEIWITFPDPQMKKTRKRLTATNFMVQYCRFLKPDGLIHLKCDSNFLFTYTREMVSINHFEVLAETDNLYHSGLADEILAIRTYYEQQWLDRGITIKYLKFIPHSENLVEPDIEIEHDSYRSFGRNQRSRNQELINEEQ